MEDDIVAAPVDLVDAAAGKRYAMALARAAGSGGEAVVWHDGYSELLLRLGRVELERRRHGIVLVHVPVFCEQTGEAEVVVPFAVSRHPRAGLVAATDVLPQGPPEVVNRWGEALVATAWEALAEMAAG